jgi:biopolymer transport protein ExbB/TolQ
MERIPVRGNHWQGSGMSVRQSSKSPREWLWFLLALGIVAGCMIPLASWAKPAEFTSGYWAKWTPERIAKLLIGPEQIACYVCFTWSMLLLLQRYREMSRQREAFELDLLPTDDGVRILPEDGRPLARRIDTATRNRPYILAKMIQLGLNKFSICRQASDVGEVVRTQTEVEQNRLVSSMGILSYLTWAIPAIGFLGTVRGLAGGMSKAGDQRDAEFLKQVTDQLGIAFDCTFVALALSVVLMYVVHVVQRAEEMLLIDCQQYCQDHLLLRLYDPQPDVAEMVE